MNYLINKISKIYLAFCIIYLFCSSLTLLTAQNKIVFPLPYQHFQAKTAEFLETTSKDTLEYRHHSFPITEILIEGDTSVWLYSYKNNVICKVLLQGGWLTESPIEVMAAYVDTVNYQLADKTFMAQNGYHLSQTMAIRPYENALLIRSPLGFVTGAGGLPNILGTEVILLALDQEVEQLSKYLLSFQTMLRFMGYMGFKLMIDKGYQPTNLIQQAMMALAKENPVIKYWFGCSNELIAPMKEILQETEMSDKNRLVKIEEDKDYINYLRKNHHVYMALK